ncbi:hypothetical protein WMY93_025695 [Mugilogobius chulae]|uniref:L1 transposable element RRM domain-containing protein n=1 Tax=Mugilogobius chulae TaxID=88201 RepID=A0AAW0MX24_9GOBI
MSGGKSKRGQRTTRKTAHEGEMSKNDKPKQLEDEEENGAAELTDTELAKDSNEDSPTLKEIREAIMGIKSQMATIIREELATFTKDLNQKLLDQASTLDTHEKAIADTQKRVSEVEASGMVTKEALLKVLKEQRKLQEKVVDLESRARRTNIRIYGIPEGVEGDSVITFVKNLLTTELPLPDNMPLQIQRAHRSLAQRPGPGTSPRSIIVNFLQFEVKEMVLRLAWKAKIMLNNKQVFFDHDYAFEVMEKRRTYKEIKRVLKEKGIRFQTPFTRIRIHWSDGPRTYADAEDAAEELRARGMVTSVSRAQPTATLEERIHTAFPWQQHGDPGGRETIETRVRHKLQEFRRGSDS